MSLPLGYTLVPPIGTPRDVYTDYRMVDKAVTIVKSAIQRYVDSFLNPNGVNRKFLTSSVSPTGLQFVTELTYDEQMKASPNLRKTYLARFFAENIGRLPSILLIDTGVEISDPGLNELVGAQVGPDGLWEGLLLSLMKVTLSITVATLSEEDTSTLATMIAMMISPLSTVVNHGIIRDQDAFWEVRLPMSGVALGQASSVTLEGDTKTTVWTRAVELACDFEAQIGIKRPIPSYVPPLIPTIGKNGKPIPSFMNLLPNQDIPLGAAYPLMINGMLKNYYLGVSDPTVALVTSEPPYLLQPRKQGRALLLVIDRSAPLESTSTTLKSSSYITDIPFIVVR